MSYWAGWTPDEEIVLVWFLSCGIKKSAVSKLIAHKCGTAQHDEQDMTHHAFELHKDSKRDTCEGFGPLLVPKSKAPTSHGSVPDVWAIDWKDSWREYNVDDWLIQKTWNNEHLDALTVISGKEEELISQVSLNDALIPELANKVLQEQFLDEIDWDWVEHRQRELVRKHISNYDGNLHTLAATDHDNEV